MKKILLIIMTLLLSATSMQAQNTDGRDFWVTFGYVENITFNFLDLQIRVVNSNQPSEVRIDFTSLGTYHIFNINPYEIFTYSLTNTEKEAVYNGTMGISNRSIRITTDKQVTVYAHINFGQNTDVTNVLPATALSTEYYQISYRPTPSMHDAYVVVATQNNTLLYHNKGLVATLDAGEVYYRTSLANEMTGAYITSNYPVAFFAACRNTNFSPGFGLVAPSLLFQQLAPVNTWGKSFFVPVTENTLDIVRIVASQNNTTITQTGGVLRTDVPGAQTTLTNLQAGQFVELKIFLDSAGCFIEADKPIGVCSYITGAHSGALLTSAAQTWVPGIEQTVSTALISPFVPNGSNWFTTHYALVFTPTATKENTEVSIGGVPATLSGGTWHDNSDAGLSFYSMPLTNSTTSYLFSNPQKMIILGYGVGGNPGRNSYYYLAYSAMRNLQAGFYVNNIYYQNLKDATIYCGFNVNFRAEIEDFDANTCTLKWYVNNEEKISVGDQLVWSENLPVGEYEIRMEVECQDGTEESVTGTLKILERWVKMRNVKK